MMSKTLKLDANIAAGEDLRPYQERILEQAKTRNTIAVLPTGTGKTLIAVRLFLHRLRLLSQSAKFAFVAPTRVLVNQQFEYISQRMPDLVVRPFTGDTFLSTMAGNHFIVLLRPGYPPSRAPAWVPALFSVRCDLLR